MQSKELAQMYLRDSVRQLLAAIDEHDDEAINGFVDYLERAILDYKAVDAQFRASRLRGTFEALLNSLSRSRKKAA